MGSHGILALAALIIAGNAAVVFVSKWTRRPGGRTRRR
jgi:uncharacterized membrane protein SpoIIM required for sporulation